MSKLSLSLHLNVRTKILLVFLFLSVLSLLATAFFALWTIAGIGDMALSGSSALGSEAVNESSSALLRSAEQSLMATAAGQAAVTDVIFSDTEATLDILAAQAVSVQGTPPGSVTAPWHARGEARPEGQGMSEVIFVPGSPVTPESEEFRSLAGMAPLLRAVKQGDPDLDSIYIATRSGVMWIYPETGYTPPAYDPRTRGWFTGALNAGGSPVWSEPYVDAAGHGLILTCSRSVTGQSGTWVIATDVTIDSVNNNILNLTLNGAGYPVLLDHRGVVISRPGLTADGTAWDEEFTPDDAFRSTSPALVAVAANMTAGRSGIEQVEFNGTMQYVAYAPVPSLNGSFALSKPVEEILRPVRETSARIDAETAMTGSIISEQTGRVTVVFALLFALLLAVVILLSFTLARIITRPVDALKHGTTAIGNGDLGYRVDLQTGDEFQDLAASFNTMAADLRISIENLQRTTAEKERYTREIEIAKEIQKSFLPESPPQIPGIAIASVAVPAMEIGGDFYDFIPAPDNRWGIAIADVSGKAISAALFMALSRTVLHVSGGTGSDPSAAIRLANRWIYEDGRSSMFVTVFYGVLDPNDLTFSYVNAGHNPPLLVRGDDVQELPGSRGIALGVVPDVSITPSTLGLRHGDLLVLYTDGVTEAFNGQDEAFGEVRLRKFFCRNRSRPAEDLSALLLAEIRAFTGTAPQSDDITLVIVKVE